MENIKKYLVLQEEMEKSIPMIIDSLYKTKFKYSSRSLLSLMTKSSYLVNSILNSFDTGNVYASSIIYRSLIEHSFKHLYILVRALNDNKDDVGHEYLFTLKSKEDLESVAKISNYNARAYPEKNKWSFKGEENKNITKIGKKFDISRIFYYLIENNNSNEKLKEFKDYKKEYLYGRLIEYTEMSSSIHGGPFSDNLLKSSLVNSKVLNKFLKESLSLYFSIVESTYLFAYTVGDDNEEYYFKIKAILESSIVKQQ